MEVPQRQPTGFVVADVFKKLLLRDVLDGITVVHEVLVGNASYKKAEEWLQFVARCFIEQNLGYRLDEQCVVHFFVDQEFERNRFATLACFGDPELMNAQHCYEQAYAYMDATPVDTKGACRSMFESIEVLTKQIVKTKNLNAYIVKNDLSQLAQQHLATDEIEVEVLEQMFNGVAEWVNSLHKYRHGQALEAPVAPSEDMAVYVLSSGSAFLRMLLTLREKIKAG